MPTNDRWKEPPREEYRGGGGGGYVLITLINPTSNGVSIIKMFFYCFPVLLFTQPLMETFNRKASYYIMETTMKSQPLKLPSSCVSLFPLSTLVGFFFYRANPGYQ